MTAPPKTGPNRLTDLWLPIGPAVTFEGQARDTPNISGRVVDIQVSPSGTRAYVASAGGGVWYTNDEGSSWLPLGIWMSTPKADQLDHFANVLATGSVAVAWDSAPGGENDIVYVGTGEITPSRRGYPGSELGGIGVLTATNPAAAARADPLAPVWTREAKLLEGRGTYRIAVRPTHPQDVIAATSDGLYRRTGPDNWTKVTAEPFDEARTVTDAIWSTHIWVALHSAGVWRADDPGGPFTKIDLDDVQGGRISLGASADGSIVYALGAGPRLWRISGDSGKRIGNVPKALFGEGESSPGSEEEEEEHQTGHPEHTLPGDIATNQAFYDMVVAVDPDHPDVVALGGSTVGAYDAFLVKCTVQNPASDSPSLNYTPANDTKEGDNPDIVNPSNDPTFIGKGVHPDVHALVFAKRAGKLDLWVGCDGGVYRSTSGGGNFTWQARNNGLAALEPGYVACHPTSESVVIVGTQDNGVMERAGDTVWRHTIIGDGGGVAFHPAHPDRYLGQQSGASWRSKDKSLKQPVYRSSPTSDSEKDEAKSEHTNFYSSPAAVAAGNPDGARIALGTNRVWVSEDFGRTWFTIPHRNDPRNQDPAKGPVRNDSGQDVFYKDARARTLACRWLGENELYVLNAESIQRYSRAPASGVWTHDKPVTAQHNKCFDYTEDDIKTPNKMPHLPPLGDWSDIAIHIPGPDGSSSLYVSCTSLSGTPKMDTLWWYDGSGNWYPTKLRDAVKAPALAVVIHPKDANTVYVGTTVGVWRGTFKPDPGGGAPTWVWSTFSTGLPEAAVQDLAFFHDPGPPEMLLLRAALQSRGVWEVDLLADCDEQTYLRLHGLDSRRRAQTSLENPLLPGISLDRFLSPDILIRPGPPVVPETAPKPPAGKLPIDKAHHARSFWLWTFQTAFRMIEPSCRPTGSWSDTFETLLVNYKRGTPALGATPNIDQATWDDVVTDARVYQAPWSGVQPTEADFVQLVMDEYLEVQPGILPARYSSRRLKADVLVHHRGLLPIKAADVAVLLLLRTLTEPDASWPQIAIDDDWKQATVLAIGTGSAPATGWPDGWDVADTTAVRHLPPGANLDAANPRAVTFDLALPSALVSGTLVMLLAVCSSPTATVTEAKLAGANLGDLVQQSRHVAAHVLALA